MDATTMNRKYNSLLELGDRIGPHATTSHVKEYDSGRKAYTEEYARNMAKEWSKGGLTRREFAEQHDIDKSTFARWVIKYKVRQSTQARATQRHAAKNKSTGATARIRAFMSDGKPHSITEVSKAAAYDAHNTGITLARMVAQGELIRPNPKVKDGVYQANVRALKAPVATSSNVVPEFSKASKKRDSVEERRQFALQQFRMNPNMKLTGKDSVESVLRDRFGMALKRSDLVDICKQAQRAAGARRHASRSAPRARNTEPASDIHTLAARFADAMQSEKQLALRLAELETEIADTKDALKTARETSTALLKQMQAAHG